MMNESGWICIIEILNDSQGNIEQLVDKVLEDWGFVDLEEENE